MNWYLILPLVQAAACLILAIVIIRNNLASNIHRLFTLFLLSLAVWGVIIFGMRASPDVHAAYLWERFLPPIGFLSTVSMLHFAILYTRRNIKRWVVIGLYSLCVLFIPLSFTNLVFRDMILKSYGYAPVFGPLAPLYMLFTFGLPIVTLIIFISRFSSITSHKERNRLLYIIIGLIVSIGGGLFDVLPTFGLPLYPGLVIGNIMLCVLVTVAIVTENLLDISIVLRKGTAYFLTSTIIVLPFVAAGLIVVFVLNQVSMPPWVYVVTVVVAVLVFPPLWRVTQQWVDRLFSRDKYETLKSLESLIKDTQSLTDSDKLQLAFVNLIKRYVRASSAFLMQPAGMNEDYVITYSSGNAISDQTVLRKDSALVPWFEQSGGGILDLEELDLIPRLQRITHREKYDFKRLGADLLVPLLTPGGKLAALLILGSKVSEQSYSDEDRNLINSAATQMVNKLENLRLYNHALKARENLENLVNSIGDDIIILGPDRKVQFMSRSAIEAFGDKIGENCWKVLGRDHICPECKFEHFSGCQRLTAPVGNRYYDVVITPLSNPDGSTSMVEVLRDITQRQQYEADLAKSYEALKKTLDDTIVAMAKIVELRDPYTSGHQRRVTELATAIALEMKLDEKRIEALRMAASIHDIGKIYVASDILSKPGKLNDLEMELVRTHAESGFEVIRDIDFPETVAKTVLQHHERLDGSGYPRGLKGEEILLEARIVAVADTVEAMASHRPYRPSLGTEEALKEISGKSGLLYDQEVVKACLRLFEKGFTFSELTST